MKKILVIEDEADLREEIVTWLLMEGFQVIEAENGRKGLEIALESNPDIILSDIMMPEMTGTEVLGFLMQKTTFDIPFLFMSALAERENIREGMKLGADDYITKPFVRAELLSSLQTRLQKHEKNLEIKNLALNELRNQIVMHLPHELRTPLNSIIGFGSMLSAMPEHFSPAEIAEFGTHIEKGGHRLHRLIENYLIYVQLALNKMNLSNIMNGKYVEMMANEVIYNLVKSHKYKNPLKLEMQATSYQLILTEEIFRKIVYELSDNAFKFSDPGSEIQISGKVANDTYLITFVNHGRGMTKDQIEKIGAYMQFDRNYYEQQGTGFGLVIAQKMVESCGGTFAIECVPNSTITVKCTFRLDKNN